MIRYRSTDEQASLMMGVIVTGFRLLEKRYPQNVTVKIAR